jgi:23S rRNA (guanine745-N1)-methyltransferase
VGVWSQHLVTGTDSGRSALDEALVALRCPLCTRPLKRLSRALRCEGGHAFDVARHGYVNFGVGNRQAANADTAAMVAARARFLDRGHYAPVAAALGSLAQRLRPRAGQEGVVVDLAGGTGYYLAAVLRCLPNRVGICIDTSKPALRRASGAHSRVAAIGADVWRDLPLADQSAAIVMNAFGPRNLSETIRVLSRGAVFLLLTPTARHLAEVREPLGMLRIDAAKADRVAARTSGLEQLSSDTLNYTANLTRLGLRDLVAMGPSAYHVEPSDLERRVGALPEVLPVTVSVLLSAYRL